LISDKNGDPEIFMKGKPFDDPYGQHTDNFISDLRDNFGPYLVPRGKLSEMGDNN